MSISESTKTVRLSDVVDAIELMPDEWSGYVNRQTGEVLSIPREAFAGLESDGDAEESFLFESDETMVALAEEIGSSTHFEILPGKFEISETSIMREFCGSVANLNHRTELQEAIPDKGAFRHFQSTLQRLNLRSAWQRYKSGAIERIAIRWLDAHGIPWTKDDSVDQIDID